MTNPPNPDRENTASDTGSITPLVIGMMLCLLLLGAGVTAAGSAFLGGQRLQHLCDGAAAAGAGILTDTSGDQAAQDTITNYLAVRHSTAATTTQFDGTTLGLTCTDTIPISFGALFGTPTLHRTVTATAQANYHRT